MIDFTTKYGQTKCFVWAVSENVLINDAMKIINLMCDKIGASGRTTLSSNDLKRELIRRMEEDLNDNSRKN